MTFETAMVERNSPAGCKIVVKPYGEASLVAESDRGAAWRTGNIDRDILFVLLPVESRLKAALQVEAAKGRELCGTAQCIC